MGLPRFTADELATIRAIVRETLAAERAARNVVFQLSDPQRPPVRLQVIIGGVVRTIRVEP